MDHESESLTEDGLLPSRRQQEFMDWEFGVFFHFGIRTFYEGHKDWDGREMPAERFDPARLDCRQWVRTARQAGARYAILVCKHHDGFANWPTAYSGYSVAHTPWRNGRGDVVREFVDACRAEGIHPGLYYSPAQAGFQQRSPLEYDEYFIRQIGELLTGYGKIDYLWFDGCGSEDHRYDTVRIMSEIRRMQPEILIFNMWDPDTRWVGNEAGTASLHNGSTVSGVDFSVRTDTKAGLAVRRFLPAECDCRIRRSNWFYSDSDANTLKSLDELMGLYYSSVGRGANLLLNVAPDRQGLLPEADARRLLEFGAEIRRRFADPLPARTEPCESGCRCEFAPGLINHAVLREDPSRAPVRSFEIRLHPWPSGEPVTVYRGGTIGHKAICRFPALYTDTLEIVWEGGCPHSVHPAVFYIPETAPGR